MNSWNPYVERKEEANYSELKRVCFPRVKRRYLLKMLCIMLYMMEAITCTEARPAAHATAREEASEMWRVPFSHHGWLDS